MKLYQFAYSPYAAKVRKYLEIQKRAFDVVEVPYMDRQEVAKLSGQIVLPVLVDGATVVADSARITAYLDGPVRDAAAVVYEQWADSVLEDVAFRIASPAVEKRMVELNGGREDARAMYRFVKERKFGAGCIDQWAAQTPALTEKLRALLVPLAQARPFLLGDRPTLADAAVWGNLAMLEWAMPGFVGREVPEMSEWFRRLYPMAMLARMSGMTSRFAAAAVALAVFATCTPDSDAGPPRKPATKDGPREVAILGAGCFWGVEHWMQMADGIVDIDVGYVGGKSAKVSYEQVSGGGTGHAEAVRIVFDPSVISYEQLLVRFYKIHDPTTKDRQGNDRGSQYRSAIFPTSEAQKQVAAAVTARVQKSGAWKAPITTTSEAPTNWVKAEDYHQDYLVKHPGGYDNHFMRDLKF